MLSTDQLVHTATLERFAGDSSSGATYGSPEAIDCYFEGGARLVQKPDNTEVGGAGTLYVNATDLPIGSRIQVAGITAYVADVNQLEDFRGLGHFEVTLSAVPRAAQTRTAFVSLARATASTWDEDNEITTPASDAVYATHLAARITALVRRAAGDESVDSAEETLTIAGYTVAVDHDETPFEGDLVTVESCPDDPTLEGRALRVVEVVRGSTRLERSLLCNLIDADPPPA